MQPSTSREEDVGRHDEREIEERVHQQLMYKDNRIIDLNNVILDKERQILDLQERVREQGEVATVKNEAIKIVQRKFEEISRERRDVATETDSELMYRHAPPSRSQERERRTRSSSPGHVIANRRHQQAVNGTFSPPPIDPPTEEADLDSSYDIDGVRKKNRKRVTFDLPPSNSGSTEQLSSALNMASSENEILRKQIEEMNEHVEKMREQYEEEISRYMKEAKTAGVRAKVVATARIKELEKSLEETTRKHSSDVERLQAEVDTLRSSREWELEQNGQLREQVSHLKEKSRKLTEELDVSEKAKRALDKHVDENKKIIEMLLDDLGNAENAVSYLESQKLAIFEDIDKLKEAISAQDRFIEVLEADIVIYEEHIGLLRESLGASKIDHRSLIKSKAFETKLTALEKEKEVSEKKSSEDRLRTKALHKKCQILQDENEKLMEKLCELEMRHGEDNISHQMADLQAKIDMLTSSLAIEKNRNEQLDEARRGLEKKLNEMDQKTNLEAAAEREQSEEIEFFKSEVERLGQIVEESANNAEKLRAENFDLQMSITKLREERSMRELDHEQYVQELTIGQESELSTILEEKQQEIAALKEEKEILRQQNEASRMELENVRLSVQESAEVKKEVKELKEMLELERDTSRHQWEEACRRMEHNPEEISRKTSVEVQNQQYILAFEEKIEELKKKLEIAQETIGTEKAEKKKLKAALKQIRDRERKKPAIVDEPVKEIAQKSEEFAQKAESESVREVVSNGWDDFENMKSNEQGQREAGQNGGWDNFETPQTTATTEELKMTTTDPEYNQDGGCFTESAQTEESAHIFESNNIQQISEDPKLTTKINDLELEVRLSEELNVELGHAMLELEKKLDLVVEEKQSIEQDHHALGMELRLHEMMVEELSTELQETKNRLEQLEKERKTDLAGQVVENIKKENTQLRAEVGRVVEDMAYYDLRRMSDSIETMQMNDKMVKSLKQDLKEATEQNLRLEAELAAAQEAMEMLAVKKVEEPTMEETIKTTEVVLTTAQSTATTSSSTVQSTSSTSAETTTSQESNELDKDAIIEENLMLRECLNQSVEVRTELSGDLSRLMQLKEELETAVQSLKAEIWSLNGQLKAALLDRENLEDRVIGLDEQLTAERKKALGLDVELQEQVDLTNKAMSRAAEAENESNRRLAECLDMESQREELEKAYASLTEYYNQLQAAYNVIYAKVYTENGEEREMESIQMTAPSMNEKDTTTMERDVDELVKILSIPTSSTASLVEKLALIVDKIRSMKKDLEESREALSQHKTIRVALEERLESAEQETGRPADTHNTAERVQQLEGEIEWKEEECESLKRRIEELEKALDTIAEKANEHEAARLTTRQADVDSLFRTNAELAHTNVRLQNELDEREEEMEKEREAKDKELQCLKEQVGVLEEQVTDLLVKLKEESSKPKENKGDWGWDEPQQHSTDHENRELREQIEQLQETEAAMKAKIQALEAEAINLEGKLEMLEEELFEQKGSQELAELKKEHARIVNEKDTLINKLHEQLEQQKKETMTQPEEENSNEQENQQLREQIDQLQETEVAMKTKIHALEAEVNNLEKKLELLEEELFEQQESQELAELKKEHAKIVGERDALIVKLNQQIEGQNEKIVKLEEMAERNVVLAPEAQENDWGWGDEPEEPEPTPQAQEEGWGWSAEPTESEPEPQPQENGWGWSAEPTVPEPTPENEDLTRKEMELASLREEVKFAQIKLEKLEEQSALEREELLKQKETELAKLEEKLEQAEAMMKNNEEEKSTQVRLLEQKDAEIAGLKSRYEQTMEYLKSAEQGSAMIAQELDETREELEKVMEQLGKSNPDKESGWDAWQEPEEGKVKVEELLEKIALLEEQNSQYGSRCADLTARLDAMEKSMKEQIKERNKIIERLELELMEVQDENAARQELQSGNQAEVEELKAEVTKLQKELKLAKEQNEVLKDTEGRLFDQANSYAETLEKYKQQMITLKKKVAELEETIANLKLANEEELKAVKLAAAKAIRHQKAVVAATRSPAASRPSSRLSTASSTARPSVLREEDTDNESVRSIPISNPLQSAFDPVVPQNFAEQVIRFLERQEDRDRLAGDLIEEMTRKNRKNNKNTNVLTRTDSASSPIEDSENQQLSEPVENEKVEIEASKKESNTDLEEGVPLVPAESEQVNNSGDVAVEDGLEVGTTSELLEMKAKLDNLKQEHQKLLEDFAKQNDVAEQATQKYNNDLYDVRRHLEDVQHCLSMMTSAQELSKSDNEALRSALALKNDEVKQLEADKREFQRQQALLVTSMSEAKTGEEVVKHLQSDNVRLERELFGTHEELTSLKEHLSDLKRSIDLKDSQLMESNNEATRLRNALEMEKFEKQQALLASDGRDATARVLQLERQISEMKTEHADRVDEMREEMRTCEERAKLAEEKEVSAIEELKLVQETMENWRNRFENAAAENESMERHLGEVRSLEMVLQKTKQENERLKADLEEFQKEAGNLKNEKQELIEKLTSLSEVLLTRTDRLAKAGEARMEQTMKIMELEMRLSDNSQKRARSSSLGAVTSDVPHQNLENWKIDLERDEEPTNRMENYLIDLESGREASEADDFLPTTPGLSHATLPILQQRLSRRLRHWRHQMPCAIYPYFRYLLTTYFVAIHLILFHCLFF